VSTNAKKWKGWGGIYFLFKVNTCVEPSSGRGIVTPSPFHASVGTRADWATMVDAILSPAANGEHDLKNQSNGNRYMQENKHSTKKKKKTAMWHGNKFLNYS
jgi:hypothetical protein